MVNFIDLFVQGGPLMKALAGMTFGVLVCVAQRGRFWIRILKQQQFVTHNVLEAARSNLAEAEVIAQQAQTLPIGRFLLAPLQLKNPTPETFRLAMQAAADKEFVEMRKGNGQLELVATWAPLFGLLGAAINLIGLFGNSSAGNAANGITAQNVIQGIHHAMIPIAASLISEIIALGFLRLSHTLQARQVDYFSQVGTKLELFYRELWQASQRKERLKSKVMSDNRRPPSHAVNS